KRKGGPRQPLRYRRFATAAEAIRFAVEELPAVALGAWMQVGDQRFDADDIQRLYESDDFPLQQRLSEGLRAAVGSQRAHKWQVILAALCWTWSGNNQFDLPQNAQTSSFLVSAAAHLAHLRTPTRTSRHRRNPQA